MSSHVLLQTFFIIKHIHKKVKSIHAYFHNTAHHIAKERRIKRACLCINVKCSATISCDIYKVWQNHVLIHCVHVKLIEFSSVLYMFPMRYMCVAKLFKIFTCQINWEQEEEEKKKEKLEFLPIFLFLFVRQKKYSLEVFECYLRFQRQKNENYFFSNQKT